MATLTPNPSSPFATAAPNVRHIFPTLMFFGDPKPGALALAGCDQLAVVPAEPLQDAATGATLPDGLCPACVAAMNGDEAAGPEQLVAECEECGISTRHNGMCALCRQEAHDEWWAQQQAGARP